MYCVLLPICTVTTVQLLYAIPILTVTISVHTVTNMNGSHSGESKLSCTPHNISQTDSLKAVQRIDVALPLASLIAKQYQYVQSVTGNNLNSSSCTQAEQLYHSHFSPSAIDAVQWSCFLPGRFIPVFQLIRHGVGRMFIWKLWRRKHDLAPTGKRTPDYPARVLASITTDLPTSKY